MFKSILWVTLGGIIGTLSRYAVYLTISFFNIHSAIATLIVNLLGCFIAGSFLEMSQSTILSSNLKLFVFIGILGAFTTFSTFTIDNYQLLQANKINQLLLNLFTNNILGLVALIIGITITKKIIN